MDMITTAISSVRSSRAKGRRVAEAGPSGLRFPSIAALGFHVMEAGEGWVITSTDEPVAVRPGDVVFTAAGVEHGIARTPCTLAELPLATVGEVTAPSGPVDFEFLCGAYPVERGRIPAFLRRLPGVIAFTPDYGRRPQLRTVVDLLRADCAEPGPGTAAGRSALIDLMIVHILRDLQERGELRGLAQTAEPGVAEALHEIHDRPDRQWTVQRLSDVAGMSRTAFTRRFTAAVGTPPMAYLIDWRLTSGARLLRETTDPLSAIARRVGYSTEFAFAAAFRRSYGIPPGRYRTAGTGRVSP
jgi:AraC-like DNA-binding protein